MVDVALQRPMCARGPGHQWLHTCMQGQGWECSCRDWYIHGLLCKAVANKGRHIPAQTAKTLTWCERSARAGRWRSGHDGHLINYLDGMDDILQGGRDEMRGYGGRAGFTAFARIFTGSFLSFWWFCCVVFVFFWLLCFPAGEKTPASNSSFTLFAFAYLESWPTMPRARSAMQEKKGGTAPLRRTVESLEACRVCCVTFYKAVATELVSPRSGW